LWITVVYNTPFLQHAGIHARFGGVGLSFQDTKGPINITFGEKLPREYPLYQVSGHR